MTRLKNIEFSENEVHRLIKKSFFSSGGEAVICRTNNPNTLYKIFIKGTMYNTIAMSENKLRKLERIHEMELKGCVRPIQTISSQGKLIGYEMTYDPNDIRFFPGYFKRSEVVRKLKETRNILQYFADHDITYGDIALRNILFNKHTGEVKFCDMDNVKIGEYPMDIIPTRLRDYHEICGIDDKTDAYMHNLLTLDAFGLRLYYSDRDDISEEFKGKAIPIVESMKEPENFQGEYIIQYIKKKE